MKRARRIPGRSSKSCSCSSGLGFTSFGGPLAHLGYFRAEFVERRKWLDGAGYVDIVALCQLLPGPASSQVAVTLGTLPVPGCEGVQGGRRTELISAGAVCGCLFDAGRPRRR